MIGRVVDLGNGNVSAEAGRPFIGAKATTLALLCGRGVRVPPAFAVPVKYFLEAARATGAEREFRQSIDEIGANCGAAPVRNESSCLLVPSGELGREVATWLSRPPWSGFELAVRSSATVEDGRVSSFAGIFESVIGVKGEAKVMDAIGQVWRSCYAPRVCAYLRRRGRVSEIPNMGVIVQRMVRADWAGTLFTADPLTGSRENFLIEYCRGLGGGIVAGTVKPMRLRIRRRTGEVDMDGSALERTVVEALWNFARSTEEILNEEYLDLEWAVEESDTWILQARPMTALTIR